MRVLARYISALFLQNFLAASLSLTLIFVMQSTMEMAKAEQISFALAITHQLFGAPEVLIRMMPPSVLISTVLTLSAMNRTNEIIACFSIGIGLTRVMSVILSLVFVISCIALVIQDRVTPALYKKQSEFYWREVKKRPDVFLDIRRSEFWYRSGNIIYDIHLYDPRTQTVDHMTAYVFSDEFELIQVITATAAVHKNKIWELKKGTTTVFTGDEKIPMTKPFDTKELEVSDSPRDFVELEREVEGLRLKELWSYIQSVKSKGLDTKYYEVRFHYRVSVSFLPIVMGLLALPFSITRRREGGVAKDLGICLGLTIAYWLAYNVSLTLGKNGVILPWIGAWLPSVLFLALAGFLIVRKQANQ